jgi:hypothetical protein
MIVMTFIDGDFRLMPRLSEDGLHSMWKRKSLNTRLGVTIFCPPEATPPHVSFVVLIAKTQIWRGKSKNRTRRNDSSKRFLETIPRDDSCQTPPSQPGMKLGSL